MAITTRKLVEGKTTLLLHVTLESDGLQGELNNEIIISPSDLIPALPALPALRIMQLWYQMSWFDVVLKYGGAVPRQVLTLTRDTGNHIDFRFFGGLSDVPTVPPSDMNGKLLVSTNGYSPLGSVGTIILELKKPQL